VSSLGGNAQTNPPRPEEGTKPEREALSERWGQSAQYGDKTL
jgi:hypothetical protein